MIKYLVNNEGADVNATTMAQGFLSRAPAWILAVENQHPECAQFLIKSGSEIREKLTSSKTSQSDRSHIVQALLQHGNVEYMSMVTDAAAMDTAVRNHALYWAAMKENIELLTALLGKEVDVNELIYGETLLNVAAQEGKFRSVDVLLQKGAAVHKGNKRRETPLSFAVRGGHVECVNRLIKAGADVKENNWILMNDAIKDKSSRCLQSLLDAGADVNQTDCQEKTFLMSAAREGNHKAVAALLSARADVNNISYGAWSALSEAAIKGSARCMYSLLKAGAELNGEHNVGSTALLSATKEHIECVDLLLRAGVDVDTTVERSDSYYYDACGSTALLVASEHGKHSIVDLLLRKGASVNKSGKYGDVALKKAVENGHAEIVEMLIGAGADVNVTDKYGGLTTILTASGKGYPQCLDLLIRAGTDVNKAFKEYGTPLYNAAENGHDQCVDLLIRAGADVNTSGSDGSTALIKAAVFEDERCLDLLLKGGADVNRADNKKNTAIILAANKGNGGSVRLLAQAGADLNAADDNGQTILMAAAVNGHNQTVTALIASGADVNIRDTKENTALKLAANGVYTGSFDTEAWDFEDLDLKEYLVEIREFIRTGNGHEECVKELIQAGADVNAVNAWQETPIVLAAGKGLNHSVDLLIKSAADVNAVDISGCTALVNASREGHEHSVDSLIQAGADVNRKTVKGDTPLLLATTNGHNKCLELLINSGADANITDVHGRTSLMIAAHRGHADCLKLLLKLKGAGVNGVDNDGNTPLFLAAHGVAKHETLRKSIPSHEECIHVLANSGADVNATDDRGNTALLYAVHGHKETHDYLREFWSHTDCVELLIQAGADVNKKVKQGVTPLMAAASIIPRMAKACFKAGVVVNQRNQDRRNALEHYLKERTGATLYEDEFAEIDREIAKLLFAAGETGTDGTTRGLPKFLRQMESKNDLRLMTLCRRAIRRHLLEASPVNLIVRIPRLELPELLKEYLLYNIQEDPYHRDDDSDISTSDIDRYRYEQVRSKHSEEWLIYQERLCLYRPKLQTESKRKRLKDPDELVQVPRARIFPHHRGLQQCDSDSGSESGAQSDEEESEGEESESGSQEEEGESESGAESGSEISQSD